MDKDGPERKRELRQRKHSSAPEGSPLARPAEAHAALGNHHGRRRTGGRRMRTRAIGRRARALGLGAFRSSGGRARRGLTARIRGLLGASRTARSLLRGPLASAHVPWLGVSDMQIASEGRQAATSTAGEEGGSEFASAPLRRAPQSDPASAVLSSGANGMEYVGPCTLRPCASSCVKDEVNACQVCHE